MLRAALERQLERGEHDGLVPTALAAVWNAAASLTLARPLLLPEHADVVAVGGATLGGSGKTPVALAVAQTLGAREDVAVVGHAYRARVQDARVVRPDDDVEVVGDEALAAARALVSLPSVRVVVGASRQTAIDLAATLAGRIVVDGPLQFRPRRARLALLAVDAVAPWGAGWCPPRGDLRSSVKALIAASDAVVAVGDGPLHATLAPDALGRPVFPAPTTLAFAFRGGERLPLTALRGARVGLWTSIARPHRVMRELISRDVVPAVTIAGADHRSPSASALQKARRSGVDVWLCTTKCQVHLGDELEGRPVAALARELTLPPALLRLLRESRGSPSASERAKAALAGKAGPLDPIATSP